MMNMDSFSHGQIHSKLWLCKEIEKLVEPGCKVAILGSWYNVLGFMMFTRQPELYESILGVDIDPDVKEIADKVIDAWHIGRDYRIENITNDANIVSVAGYDLVINCSPEHMDGNEWFEALEDGTMVCIQSSDVQISDDDVWKCVNPNLSLEDLTLKYPMTKYLYSGEREFRYSEDNGYKRFMIIGVK